MGTLSGALPVIRTGRHRIDLGQRGLLRFHGPEALTFLQGQTSNDVLALEDGRGCHLVFANPKGHVLADGWCFRTGDDALVEMDEACAAILIQRLGRYLMLAEAELIDLSGPCTLVTGDWGPGGPGGVAQEGDTWRLGAPRLGSVPCHLILGDVPEHVLELPEAAPEAAEVIRIEEGIPRFGAEIGEGTLPQEAGLNDAISFTKGCFTGQETIARLHYRGRPARELRGVVLPEGADPPAPGAALFHDDREAGQVTSSCKSPGLGRAIGLALVRRRALAAEHVEVEGARAVLRPLPLFTGQNERGESI